MAKTQIFNFDELAGDGKAAQKMAKAFERAGASVVQSECDGRVRRTLSVSYKELSFTFADGQQIVLQIKKTGDVGTVKLNGKAMPIKDQDDQGKAVAELVQMMDAGRAKFQAALAKKKVALPKGIKTAAPKMEAVLTARVAELDTQISEKRASIDNLKAQLAA